MDRGSSVLDKLFFCLVAIPLLVIGARILMAIAPPWPNAEGSTFVLALADVLRALQWPLVAFIIANYFRADIQQFLKRVVRGRLFGGELELQQSIGESEAASTDFLVTAIDSARAADSLRNQTNPPTEQQLPLLDQETETEPTYEDYRSNLEPNPERILNAIRANRRLGPPEQGVESGNQFDDISRRVLAIADASPALALRVVNNYLARAVDSIAIENGRPDVAQKRASLALKATELESDGIFSTLAADAIRKFSSTRSLLLSTKHSTPLQVLHAVDSGLAILAALISAFDLPKGFAAEPSATEDTTSLQPDD